MQHNGTKERPPKLEGFGKECMDIRNIGVLKAWIASMDAKELVEWLMSLTGNGKCMMCVSHTRLGGCVYRKMAKDGYTGKPKCEKGMREWMGERA